MTTTTADMNTTTEIAAIINAITLAEESAQNAEDRDQMGRASKIRSQVRILEAQLAALRTARVSL